MSGHFDLSFLRDKQGVFSLPDHTVHSFLVHGVHENQRIIKCELDYIHLFIQNEHHGLEMILQAGPRFSVFLINILPINHYSIVIC